MKNRKKLKEQRVKDYRQLCAPRVIKKGEIQPTTCGVCHTVYQAKWRHLLLNENLSYLPPRLEHYTRCPACQVLNRATFAVEEVSEG